MVNTDECLMEAVQPHIVWVNAMGYEVDKSTLKAYAQVLLSAPVSDKEEKFGTAKKMSLKIHQEFVMSTIKRKMRRDATEKLVAEGHEREEVEKKVKILDEQQK